MRGEGLAAGVLRQRRSGGGRGEARVAARSHGSCPRCGLSASAARPVQGRGSRPRGRRGGGGGARAAPGTGGRCPSAAPRCGCCPPFPESAPCSVLAPGSHACPCAPLTRASLSHAAFPALCERAGSAPLGSRREPRSAGARRAAGVCCPLGGAGESVL